MHSFPRSPFELVTPPASQEIVTREESVLGPIGTDLKRKMRLPHGVVRKGGLEPDDSLNISMTATQLALQERRKQIPVLLEMAQQMTASIESPVVRAQTWLHFVEHPLSGWLEASEVVNVMMDTLEEIPAATQRQAQPTLKGILWRVLDACTIPPAILKRIARFTMGIDDGLVIHAKILRQEVSQGEAITPEEAKGIFLSLQGMDQSVQAGFAAVELVNIARLQHLDVSSALKLALELSKKGADSPVLRSRIITVMLQAGLYSAAFELMGTCPTPDDVYKFSGYVLLLRSIVRDHAVAIGWRKRAFSLLKGALQMDEERRRLYIVQERAADIDAEIELDKSLAPRVQEYEAAVRGWGSEPTPTLYLSLARIRHAYGEKDAADLIKRAKDTIASSVFHEIRRFDILLSALETEGAVGLDLADTLNELMQLIERDRGDERKNAADNLFSYEKVLNILAKRAPDRVLSVLNEARAYLESQQEKYPAERKQLGVYLHDQVLAAVIAAETLYKERYQAEM